MKISLNWLKEYLSFEKERDAIISPELLAEQLMMLGIEVEKTTFLGRGLESVVVGKIESVKAHPQADKLVICQVDVGQEQDLQIVCGAPNATSGLIVPVALVGAILPNGLEIKTAQLRGIPSYGMLCSADELKLSEDHSGLMELPDNLLIGTPLSKALDLDDIIMDLEITPNRPDCLSMVGIAREIRTIMSLDLEDEQPTFNLLQRPNDPVQENSVSITELTSVEILDPNLCARYATRIIQGIKVGPSPDWLESRLKAVGLTPINNVVDVTNLVMLELGQPLHAFDYHKLNENRIVVRRAEPGEVPTTLDEIDRALTDDMLVIADAIRPVAVAGVMGGLESAISRSTVDILLESAYFNPVSIRRTAKALGMHTDASHRFERGTDPEGVIPALNRAASLIHQLAGGTVAKGIIDVYPAPKQPREIHLRPSRVNHILGTDITLHQMNQILILLGFDVEVSQKNLSVTAPTFRPDVEREIDLVEEIARVYGYDRIPTEMPAGHIPIPKRELSLDQLLKSHLLANGLMEAINYSFYHADMPARSEIRDHQPIPLKNPLNEDFSVLRTSLLPSLLANVHRNRAHQVPDIRLFEAAKVFHRSTESDNQLPIEICYLAAVLVGSWGTGSYGDNKIAVDFYDLKGLVEGLLETIGINDYDFRLATNSTFHPGRSAELWHREKYIGVLGEIHPQVTENFDLSDRIYAFELDVDTLSKFAKPNKQFVPIPTHPGISRDLAILVPQDLPADQPLEVIKAVGQTLVDRAYLFDLYTGDQIPEGKKSLAYSIKYHAKTETLTDAIVDALHQKIVTELVNRFDAELRI